MEELIERIMKNKAMNVNVQITEGLTCNTKYLAKLLEKKLNLWMKKTVGDQMIDLMRGKSTTEQIFKLRQILEKCQEYNIELRHLFDDFR